MTNEELQQEMIAAMKAKDKVRLSIIRQVKAEVKNIEVNERRDVTEEDVNSMIKRLIKQTSETLEMSINETCILTGTSKSSNSLSNCLAYFVNSWQRRS